MFDWILKISKISSTPNILELFLPYFHRGGEERGNFTPTYIVLKMFSVTANPMTLNFVIFSFYLLATFLQNFMVGDTISYNFFFEANLIKFRFW